MPAESIPRLFARLRRSAPADPTTDAALLDRFLATRDDAAFTTLVRRHAPMVMGVCRRVLGNEADAEDACQATFLVLVRKAGSIRPRGAVAGWLHGVARNTARRARLLAARRRRHEANAGHGSPSTGVDGELRELIDSHLDRLPGRCKTAIVLCDLEGLTREEAARRLGWPVGTVASRLVRGRRLLARGLARAGLTASAALAGICVGSDEAAGVSPELVEQLAAAAAGAPSAVTPAALALTHGVARTMTLKKFTLVSLAVLITGILGLTLRQALPAAPAQVPQAGSTPPDTGRTVPIKADDKEPLITLRSVPAVVVRTVPASGASDVDPGLTEVKVTYSKEMTDKSWSWSYLSEDTQLPANGDDPIHYEKDKRTCVIKVKLEPGKIYAVWLNSERYHNFKDADGQPAVPYLLVFKTKKAD
jgi:RNA polymerase sigma-70 factor (ECF subfamily)